jgi:hypothetical protein
MSKPNQIRLFMLIPTVMLGRFIISFFHTCWVAFCLTQGAGQTTAIITNERSHGVVDYTYTVESSQYVGHSQRGRDQGAAVGGQTLVYFSSARPWLSSLQTPSFPPSGALFMLIPLSIEFLLVMTVINPKGKWAFQTGLKNNESVV